MSTQCPKCGSEIDSDFGLVNCHNCNAVLSIDVNGEVQVAEEQPIEAPEGFELSAPSESADVIQIVDEPLNPIAEQLLGEIENKTNEVVQIDQPVDFENQDLPELQPEPEAHRATNGLQEIVEYANEDKIAGPLSYTVVISGIDLPETRKFVIDALSLSKFAFQKGEVQNKIKNGILVLQGLTPAKAVMIIRSLKGSKVKISWSQQLYA